MNTRLGANQWTHIEHINPPLAKLIVVYPTAIDNSTAYVGCLWKDAMCSTTKEIENVYPSTYVAFPRAAQGWNVSWKSCDCISVIIKGYQEYLWWNTELFNVQCHEQLDKVLLVKDVTLLVQQYAKNTFEEFLTKMMEKHVVRYSFTKEITYHYGGSILFQDIISFDLSSGTSLTKFSSRQ